MPDLPIETNDPDVAREQIERTRARMSGTLDEIEAVLAGKKKRIQEQLDVVSRIRERPLHAAGAVFLGGLFLGFLTGGRKGGDGPSASAALARGAAWESRARRLLEIARAQEEEVERLRAERGLSARPYASRLEADDLYDDELEDLDDLEEWDEEDEIDAGDDEEDEWDDDEWEEPGGSGLSALKDSISERMKEVVAEATRSLAESIRSRR